MGHLLAVISMFLSASAAGAPQVSKQELLRGKLVETIQTVDGDFDGLLGVGILDLTSGDAVLHNPDQVFPVASTIKILVLGELFRQAWEGKLRLDDPYTLRQEDIVGGDGVLQHLTPGTVRVTIRDLAALVVTNSDNTATNVLIDRLGTASIKAFAERLGLKETRLRRKMMDTRAAAEGRENTSTPREMLRLLETVYREATLLELLSLPKDSYMPRDLPPGVRIANKPGSLDGVRSDAGVVFVKDRPFVIAVMTTYAANERAAESAISDIAAAAYRYFDRLARSSEYGRRMQ